MGRGGKGRLEKGSRCRITASYATKDGIRGGFWPRLGGFISSILCRITWRAKGVAAFWLGGVVGLPGNFVLILERVCVDIVEEVKRVNRIEDVMEETGGLLIHKHGRYLRGREHDSLVVDTHEQYYTWNSQNETGDVISWLERRKKWDFKTAVEWLAQRAHLPMPEWGQENNAARLAARTREDALTVAARVFVRWLRSSPAAAAYLHARCWTEETVRAAGLGYTGGGTSEERTDLEGELNMHAFETNNHGKPPAL